MALLYHYCWVTHTVTGRLGHSLCPFPYLCCKDARENDKPHNQGHPGKAEAGEGNTARQGAEGALTAFVTRSPRGRNTGLQTRLPERKAT